VASGPLVIACPSTNIMPGALTVGYLENTYSYVSSLFLFGNVALPKTLPDISEAFIFVLDGREKKVCAFALRAQRKP
jgi:hypothetical protein